MKSFIEKNKNRKPLREILPLDMPLGLCIEPTNLCNFKCKQCPVSLPEFKSIVKHCGDIDDALYNKILKDIKNMGKLNNFNLYGDGEPFLNKKLPSMIKMARELDVSNYITVTTNASLLEPEIVSDLLQSGLDYLRISIYSVYPEKFKNITQSKYHPDEIYKKVKYLKETRDKLGLKQPFIYVKMIDTYSEENDEFMNKYLPIADQVNIEKPMNWNGYNNIDLISNIDKNHNTDETQVQGYHANTNVSGFKKICTTPFLSLNIKSNGDVCICIVDWNKGTKIGNINDESLEEIWFGKNLKEFRKMHIEQRRNENESCKNCNHLYSSPDNIDDFTEEEFNKILNYKIKD